MSERLSISNIEVHVRRSDRRQTIGLTVERDGSVVAAVPLSIPLGEVERQLRCRELWLQSALTRRASLTPPATVKQYHLRRRFSLPRTSLQVARTAGRGRRRLNPGASAVPGHVSSSRRLRASRARVFRALVFSPRGKLARRANAAPPTPRWCRGSPCGRDGPRLSLGLVLRRWPIELPLAHRPPAARHG